MSAGAIEPRRTYLDGEVTSYRLGVFRDARGELTPMAFHELPLAPVRAFVVRAPQGAVRGQHAHRCGRQLLVCISGSIEIELRLGARCDRAMLERPGEALLIPAPVWAQQTYLSDEGVLLVLSDTPYDPANQTSEL